MTVSIEGLMFNYQHTGSIFWHTTHALKLSEFIFEFSYRGLMMTLIADNVSCKPTLVNIFMTVEKSSHWVNSYCATSAHT